MIRLLFVSWLREQGPHLHKVTCDLLFLDTVFLKSDTKTLSVVSSEFDLPLQALTLSCTLGGGGVFPNISNTHL